MNTLEWLDRLEESFSALDQKKKVLYFILFAIVIGYLFFIFLIEPNLELLEEKKQKITTLEQKIKKRSPKMLERKITKIKKDIVKFQSKKEQMRQQLYALQSQLLEKRSLLYSPKSFSSFLDALLNSSVKHRILLHSVVFQDLHEPYMGLLEKRKSLELNGTAQFLDIVRFVRSIEDQKLLLKIDKLMIETNGTIPNFNLSIELFGATL